MTRLLPDDEIPHEELVRIETGEIPVRPKGRFRSENWREEWTVVVGLVGLMAVSASALAAIVWIGGWS